MFLLADMWFFVNTKLQKGETTSSLDTPGTCVVETGTIYQVTHFTNSTDMKHLREQLKKALSCACLRVEAVVLTTCANSVCVLPVISSTLVSNKNQSSLLSSGLLQRIKSLQRLCSP